MAGSADARLAAPFGQQRITFQQGHSALGSLFDSDGLVPRLLGAALLATVFGVSLVFGSFLSMRGGRVEVPNLMGKSEIEAAKELDDHGLKIKVTSRAGGEGAVVDQSPAAGDIIKTGQLVRVSVGTR